MQVGIPIDLSLGSSSNSSRRMEARWDREPSMLAEGLKEENPAR